MESMRKTILAFGETLWDLLPAGAVLGGAPFNFAYRVDCLGETGWIVSRLGRDELGRRAWEQIVALGMETRFIQWDEARPTGTVPITLDENNNPDFVILPDVAYDYIEATEELLAAAAEADCVCFGTLVQRAPVSRRTLQQVLGACADGLKILDINLRRDCYTTETITTSLERADVLKCNDDEARYLADLLGVTDAALSAFCEAMIDKWSLSHCVVTLGERGAFAASADGRKVYVPGYSVEVIDTCGAGDAFTAGFACRLLLGRSLAACCELGNALGAIVAGQKGATAPLSPEDVDRFLQEPPARIVDPALEPFRTG